VKWFGAFVLIHFGWRYAFWACTSLSFAIWWLIYFWQRNSPEDAGLDPIVSYESADIQTVSAAQTDGMTGLQYLRIAVNPVVLAMGASYFCIKFLRYELDSWLPAFFNELGLAKDQASYYSTGFDLAGMVGAILAGWALDRHFKGNWAKLCFVMALGMIVGYGSVLFFQNRLLMQAICFSFVGLMIYGPDTLLCGAAAVQVAGEKNGVAVAGIVNGLGSIGPVVQEKVISMLVGGNTQESIEHGIYQANVLTLCMSILFAVLMLVAMYRLKIAHRRNAS
ncbi:MFS transporter, partial [Candidatus Sumerlaeota bacterium]|nr:MFS transporter [Candidatus Sumerlaeota bacterium]